MCDHYSHIRLGPQETQEDIDRRTKNLTNLIIKVLKQKDNPMHDAKGRELKVGDKVMIPCVIKQIHASEDYCNVNLESIATMPGNNQTSGFSAVNTKQILRANEGDDLNYTVLHVDAETRLQ